MFKKIYPISVSFMLFFLSGSIVANTVEQGPVKVQQIYAGYQNKNLFFSINDNPRNVNECPSTKPSNPIIAVSPGLSDTNHVMSLLMMAKSMDLNVHLDLYSEQCYGTHVVLRRLYIE